MKPSLTTLIGHSLSFSLFETRNTFYSHYLFSHSTLLFQFCLYIHMSNLPNVSIDPWKKTPNSFQQRAVSERVCVSLRGPGVRCLTKRNLSIALKWARASLVKFQWGESLSSQRKDQEQSLLQSVLPSGKENRAEEKVSLWSLCVMTAQAERTDRSKPGAQRVFSKASVHVCLSLVHTLEMKAQVSQRKCYLLDKTTGRMGTCSPQTYPFDFINHSSPVSFWGKRKSTCQRHSCL